MSDDPQQGTTPGENTPPQGANLPPPIPPAQESFGPPFPENPPASTPPYTYSPMPDASGAQFAYPNPQPFGAPAAYGYALPLQGAYGPPPGGFAVPPVGPLPLGQALRQLPRQYWNIFTHPKAATFAWEQNKAAWNIIWMQLLFLAIAEALVILALVFLEFFLIQMIVPSNTIPLFSLAFPITAVIVLIGCAVGVPLWFFAGSGILHLIARAFGGQGTFLSYAYSYSLITVSMGIASVVLSLIPCVGSFAGLAGGVYTIILLIYMTMGVHRLSGGKASASVLIPIGTAIVLVVGAYVAYIIWVFSMISTLPHQ